MSDVCQVYVRCMSGVSQVYVRCMSGVCQVYAGTSNCAENLTAILGILLLLHTCFLYDIHVIYHVIQKAVSVTPLPIGV